MILSLKPLPAKEAIDYFKAKGFKFSFSYLDIAAQEHQAAFTVAKMMQLDLLADTRDAVLAAITAGESLATFQETLIPTLQATGWWGRKKMTDPLTNEVKDVQLGSPRRLRTIYTTNIRRAHAEGQWDRIQEVKEDFPYLQYDGLNSIQPRESHRPFDGMVLPVDDPFWTYHAPPREYNCKCRVIQLDGDMLEARGLKVSPSPKIPTQPFLNKRTGQQLEVPKGVNPAFFFKMGQGRAKLNEALVQKLNLVDESMARAVVQDIVASPEFSAWHDAIKASDKHVESTAYYPVGVLNEDRMAMLGTDAKTVSISEFTVAKQKDHHPELAAAEYRQVQRVLDKGVPLNYKDRHLGFYLNEDNGYYLVIKTTVSKGEVFLQSYRRISSDALARDKELKGLLKREKAHQGGAKK
ncbi:MAG TPA: phage minor head protein [Fluviicoccus sp.]|nr:phage minor head protein [Fluviicoccus sp.]